MARTWPNNASNRLKVGGDPSYLNPFVSTIADQGHSWSVWVKLNSNGAADQTIVSKYNGSFGGLLRTISGKLRYFNINTSSAGFEAIGATTIPTGVWTHCGCSYDGGSSRVYVNGVVDAAPASSTVGLNSTSDTTDGWTFGARAQVNSPLDGVMGEMAYWSDILTAEEFAALAKGVSPFVIRPARNSGSVGIDRKLQGYWPTFSSSDNQVDYSGNGNNLVLVGTLASADHAPVGPQIPQDYAALDWNLSTSQIKTVEGLALANVKTVLGLPLASVKTIEGLA